MDEGKRGDNYFAHGIHALNADAIVGIATVDMVINVTLAKPIAMRNVFVEYELRPKYRAKCISTFSYFLFVRCGDLKLPRLNAFLSLVSIFYCV